MGIELVIILIVMMVAMMFFSSRGRKKQEEQVKKMHDEIEIGSWVRTGSGYYGMVSDIDGDVYILQSPSGDETYWDRRAIAMVGEPPFENTDDSELEGNEEPAATAGEPSMLDETDKGEDLAEAEAPVETTDSEESKDADSDASSEAARADESEDNSEPEEDIWDDSFTKSDRSRDDA